MKNSYLQAPEKLVVVETHPVQYHAPVYRCLAELGLPVQVIYGSNFSVRGYTDREFGAHFSWDTDLLSGYESLFLEKGGQTTYETVSSKGIMRAMKASGRAALLLLGYSHPFDRAAFRSARSLGWPILYRGEAADHLPGRSGMKRWLRDLVLRWFYNRCSRLLCIGEGARLHYKRFGISDSRLYFSPYCVDIAGEQGITKQFARTALALKEDERVLLFSGKLIARKRPDRVVRAAKALPEDIRRLCTVVFVGSGPEENQIRILADTKPKVRCIFAGFKNQSELSVYYRAADLLVFPSAYETWGLVVNEALSHGIPAIVTPEVGCAPDLVRPGITGEIVAGSDDELADAIGRALGYARSADTQRQCRDLVKRYSVSTAAKGIEAAFRSLGTKGEDK